jgi:hypothetical protein
MADDTNSFEAGRKIRELTRYDQRMNLQHPIVVFKVAVLVSCLKLVWYLFTVNLDPHT